MIFLKALPVWLCFGVLAFTLGALREVFLRPLVGELRAHQVGTVLVVAGVGMRNRLSPHRMVRLAESQRFLGVSE